MKTIVREHEFVVVGGGLAGICAALTSARAGVDTALVQDRPVLGGNASKEIRVPPVGATGCNYLYCRETGIIEEIQLTNLFLNPSGNHERWDLLLQSLVYEQEKLSCYLDTVVLSASTEADGARLESVTGVTLGAELFQEFHAGLFADCTGDGTVAALAGAPCRVGKESRKEFGESLAPAESQQGGMGMSIHFRSRDIGRPAPFTKPAWVDLELDHDSFGPFRHVCGEFKRDLGGYWWLEWGGNLDPVHETPVAKKQILKIVYAVWSYLKNQSEISDAIRTYELDWVGSIPGKRESRRIVGDYVLRQTDIERAVVFDDAIAYGGWGFDDHPGDGFLTSGDASYHVKHASPYNIPLRSLYSRDVGNLLLAGRDISVTHVGLTSTRVMLTCAQTGEAVGAAAAACASRRLSPRDLALGPGVRDLQLTLQRADHYIHGVIVDDPDDLAPRARVTSSSVLSSAVLEESCDVFKPDGDLLWQFPVVTNCLEEVHILLDLTADTELEYLVWCGATTGNTYPEERVHQSSLAVHAGGPQWVRLPVPIEITQAGWHYLELRRNPYVSVHVGDAPPVGLAGFTVAGRDPIRPNPYSRWRQFGRNSLRRQAFCFRTVPEQPVYDCSNASTPPTRPWGLPNLWSSGNSDDRGPEWIQFEWDEPQRFSQVMALFDSSLDFTFHQNWLGYPENVIPSLVSDYELQVSNDGDTWSTVVEVGGNFLRRRHHRFTPVTSRFLRLMVSATRAWPRVQLYALRVWQ